MTAEITPRCLTRRVLPGARRRYRLESCRTRFGTQEWFLIDVEEEDPETGLHATAAQGTLEECMEVYYDRCHRFDMRENARMQALAEIERDRQEARERPSVKGETRLAAFIESQRQDGYSVQWAQGQQDNLTIGEACSLVRNIRHAWDEREGVPKIHVRLGGSLVAYADLERLYFRNQAEAARRAGAGTGNVVDFEPGHD